jgi:hypothetical protein
MKGVKKKSGILINDYKHTKNESTYASKGKESILQQMTNGWPMRNVENWFNLPHCSTH